MAFNTTAASNTPDLKRLPISALHPGLPSLATQSIVAIVTLVWPYSSSTRSCALLLAEPDFRLRRRRGQVRVQFFADAAHAVATSGVGIGDVVMLRLGPSVQWLASSGEEEVVRTPGKSVEWELGYRRALRLRAWRDGELLASLDVRSEATPERQMEEVEEDHVYNTPSKIVGRFSGEGLKMGSWASPAFLKRSRLSLDSARDGHDIFADEGGYVEGKGRKKRKSWMNVGMWTYANRTPSPEKGEVLSADGAMSPSPEGTITAQPADVLHTPESTNTVTEVDENEELALERPEHEPVQDHLDISPSPASREAAEQLKEETIDQQYLQEAAQPDFVRGDTEENTEVDELFSEPEDRMEGQLSFQELKAIEQDESSTEEDEPPLLVPGAVLQSQVGDYSGDTEEDSDDAFLQVKELDRSLTPTEVDSDEDEGSESEEGSTAGNQVARSPLESLAVEETLKTRNKEQEPAEAAAEPQSSGICAMLPPALRPSVSDESATKTPPRTPQSSAQGPGRAPPTPQLQPVTSINLPLPSPFPGTSASEPASYMDARPLPQAQGTTETGVSLEPQQLPVVEEEREPEEILDASFSVVPPIDSGLDQAQISTDGSLSDLKGMPELSEPFGFGLDGSVLSRMIQGRASDVGFEQPPAGTDNEKGGHDDIAKPTSTGPTAIASETSRQTQARSPSKEPWMDVLVQDKLEGENQESSQMIVSLDKESLETPKRTLETAPPLKDQPDRLPEALQPAAHDSVETVQHDMLGADEASIFQDAVDDCQPQSLSFDDGYVPMIDDWDMPNLDSDPPDISMAEPDRQDPFAPDLEEDREKTPTRDAKVASPQPEVDDIAEKSLVESTPKPARPEVTIIDLDSDSEDEEVSDTERITTTKSTPQAAVTSPAPVPIGKENLQGSWEAQLKPAERKTPQKQSFQALSPSKSSQQRFRTPFSDFDHTELSQGGTPRRHRLIATPASQAASIADRVSSRRRRTGVKDSEFEWDSTASVSTQKLSSPPSEAADAKLSQDNENHSTATTTNFLEELPQKPAVPAERSSPPVQAARLRPWENDRYPSPFTSQILEELSQKPLEELSQRPSQFHGLSKQTPQKPPPVSTIEEFAPSSPGVEQTARAPSESSEGVHESPPTADKSSRAPSEVSQYVGEGTPAVENFRNVVRTFVRSSSPLPEHVERTSKEQQHSSMLVDDPSLMRALQSSQAPFSTQLRDRMASSPPVEDETPTFDFTQVEDTVTQKRVSSPARSPSVASTARRVADRSSPVSPDAMEAAPSEERGQSFDDDVLMEDGKILFDKDFELSQDLPNAAAGVKTASRPPQESLLTPEPSQQNAHMPSSFPANEIEQTLPPTPRLTQASHAAEGFDLTQVKAKTQDLKITEPASQHEERADITMGDTTLVEPPASQSRTVHQAEPTSPSFSVKSVEELKSPSPTFSERVRLYQSSQPGMSQLPVFSQSQGLRTSLGYFTSLSSLPQHLNSQAQIDVLAVCTRATKRPERATAGPKDYFTSFRIADKSLGTEATSVQVQVFRPWKAALPECDVGDAVLLRNFVPKSRKGKVGLISAAESAWCVFRYGKNLTQRAAAKQDHTQSQSQSKLHANGDVDGDGDDTQKQRDADKDEAKKGKRKSDIMHSLRPIWADTYSPLWGDLTGVVDGLDDEDASEAKGEHDANGSTETGKKKETEQEGTSDLEHGRYNPESGASREECHGPPVEYGDQERREARRLREWWVGGGGDEVAKINEPPQEPSGRTLQTRLEDICFADEKKGDLSRSDIAKVAELVGKMLRMEPAERASAAEILEDPWFADDVELVRETLASLPTQQLPAHWQKQWDDMDCANPKLVLQPPDDYLELEVWDERENHTL
ncbi:hypothetical protein IWX90DRAFT_511731 [Phyllosticta citrichinensis]|uniref:Telomeric single stranded DNA binding POT1/Cdc13 domain-containing protein n=1 Tax=Phyllosticta citrichinensis TaxID=1130410 RepID=A0ABR1XYC2_9PEZI